MIVLRPPRLASRRRETVCGVCHSPPDLRASPAATPFEKNASPPGRPLRRGARVRTPTFARPLPARRLVATARGSDPRIDQHPDCQRGSTPGLARRRSRRFGQGARSSEDGPAPRPNRRKDRERTTAAAGKARRRRFAVDRGPPGLGARRGGKDRFDPTVKVDTLTADGRPMQESGAKSERVFRPRGEQAYGRLLEIRGGADEPWAAPEEGLAAIPLAGGPGLVF